MGTALYRKYRPTKLSEVVGQSHITTSLENALSRAQFSHAYLFIGPRGTGKTSVARIFAHAINNFPYHIEDYYLDIIEIDAASNTGVDNIRELREKAIIAPTKGQYKVYIIDEIHMLSKSAANALLKTLEEPPAHVIFILATTDAHKVPITISSRTQTFVFKLADAETMFNYLHQVAQQEKLQITDTALKIIAHRGGGSFRDSLSLLDQVSTLSSQKIDAELINSALGLPTDEGVAALLQAYQAADLSQVHKHLKDLLNSGIKAEILAEELIQHILNHPNPTLLSLLGQLPEVREPFPEAKLLLALLSFAQSTTPLPTSTNSLPTSATVAPPTVGNPTTNAPIPKSEQFSWTDFIAAIAEQNTAIAKILEKCRHEQSQRTLTIYPPNSYTLKILQSSKNQTLLQKNCPHFTISIEVANTKNYPQLSQISAIMGDIQELNNGGDIPF